MYTTILIDDEALVLSRLSLGFEWEETEFDVIAAFTDSREALEAIGRLQPDLVFTDIKMPYMTGLEIMEKARRISPNTKFVVISGYEDFTYIRTALSLGAAGYCVKPLNDEDIVEVLEKIQQELTKRHAYLCALLTSSLECGKNMGGEERFEKFLVEMGEVYGIKPPLFMGVATGDIGPLLEGNTVFVSLCAGEKLFFYFLKEEGLFQSAVFGQKLAKMIRKKELDSFAYIELEADGANADRLQSLIHHAYDFFLTGEGVSEAGSRLIIREGERVESPYLHSLEHLYGERRDRDFLTRLEGYGTEYRADMRNMSEALRIYNLTMMLVHQMDHEYFEEHERRPEELAAQFADFDDMMSYLIRILGEGMARAQNQNWSKIKNDTCKKILEYLCLHFTEAVSFQEICRKFAISPSYLSQIFQKELGETFTAYVTRLRIDYARNLLETTGMPIAQVGEKAGYEQFYYFSRLFKKQTGLSPSRYREEFRNGRLKDEGWR